LEILQRPFPLFRIIQVLPEERQGVFCDLIDALFEALVLWRERLALRHGDVVFLGQEADRFGKAQVFFLHDQGKDVPTGPASEAVVELFVVIQVKRGSLFRVEGAESDMPAPSLLELRVLGCELGNVGGLSYLIDDFHI